MSKYRKYTFYKGKRILVSWMDRHCIKCGKFLRKTNTKEVCSKCAKHNALIYGNKLYRSNEEFREERKLRSRIYRNPNRFKIGGIV